MDEKSDKKRILQIAKEQKKTLEEFIKRLVENEEELENEDEQNNATDSQNNK